MCTRRRCCYGMPAAALLVRQGNESRVAYRFLPPNSVQVVAHIFAVSPFSTFDSRPSTASERITAWREGLPLTVSAKFRSTDRSPFPPPDITTVATEQAPPAGLPPARTSASIAARHPAPFAIRLHPICWRMVTTSKHCRGWVGRCREAIMEIPTENHKNEAATKVFNFEQTARVLTC